MRILEEYCIIVIIVSLFVGLLMYFNSSVPPDYEDIEDLVYYKVTAYCPCEICCGEYADGFTASGYKIRYGDKFCAAPQQVPFGTMIDIPSYGFVPVLDRGGAIKDKQLDVYFDTHQEALNWGVKCLRVTMQKIDIYEGQ